MILQGNQRSGARDLALHLLKDENDIVEVHELRGFISDDLVSALNEAYAISRGTKAKQFLYSLSLNPPAGEHVSTEDFVSAINRVEDRLGLTGQPRGIVFHEKLGTNGQTRRHCHAVWSRIDTENMKAIPLPYTKYKLRDLSRDLYIEHGWDMPGGFLDPQERDPKNFTHQQWQQAKRQGKDPRTIKAAIQDSWAISDTQKAFEHALKERGFTLAKGDRRGFVALDQACEVYSIPKWVGLKTKQVKSRLTDQENLPSVDEAKQQIAQNMGSRLEELRKRQNETARARQEALKQKRAELLTAQTEEREKLKTEQETRWAIEVRQRQERYNTGLRGLLDRVTGRHKKLKAENERETLQAYQRDQHERDDLTFRQIEARQRLQMRSKLVDSFREKRQQSLSQDIEQFREISQKERDVFEFKRHMKNQKQDRGLDRRR